MEIVSECMSPVAEVSLLKSLHSALLLIICRDVHHAELPTLLITTAQSKQHDKDVGWCTNVDMQATCSPASVVMLRLHLCETYESLPAASQAV